MFYMIIGFLAVDLFFVGICLYIKALYDELIYMLRQVDEHKASADERELQISNCINFHIDILGYSFNDKDFFNLIFKNFNVRFIEWANRILNSVIFIQFTYSLLTIVTCIMSGTYVRNYIINASISDIFINVSCVFSLASQIWVSLYRILCALPVSCSSFAGQVPWSWKRLILWICFDIS